MAGLHRPEPRSQDAGWPARFRILDKAQLRKSLSTLLSLFLALFCADAVVSLLDDTLLLALGRNPLTVPRMVLSGGVLVLSIGGYVAMALVPMIPKRVFLPLVLFNPAVALALIPLTIYHFAKITQLAWWTSVIQVVLGFGVLFWVQRGWKLRWPALPEERLYERPFRWRHLLGFAAANLLVLAPAVGVYLAVCASLAVSHLSGGFLTLNAHGLTARAKTYQRSDGRTVRLVPMMHVGERGFYRKVAESFPTNAVILLEGVTDRQKLIKHDLNYNRMASSLGLVEQREHFGPERGRPRRADVDVEQFSPATIEFLNVAARIHSEGFTPGTVRELSANSQTPQDLERLWRDLLTLRNDHLMQEVRSALANGDDVVAPWGAAHMPGLARLVEGAGFQLAKTEEFPVIRFRQVNDRDAAGRRK